MATVTSAMSKSESGLRLFVKRNPVLSMSILTILFAWPAMIWEALYSRGLVPTQSPLVLSLAIGWVPGIAAVVVSAVLAGRAGVRKLLGRFLIWRVGALWYLVAFSLLAVLILGGIGLHVLFGGATPPSPAAGLPLWEIGLGFLILVVAGILINSEEIAWRGFAVAHMQVKYGALAASLLVAIPESILHLPYFWNNDVDFYQKVGMFWFTMFGVALALIYTFIFNKTKGSLIIVTILHASQNAWANILSDNSLRPFQFTVALIWMIAIALIFLTKGQLGYEPTQATNDQ